MSNATYNQYLTKNTDHFAKVGWGSLASQVVRFEVLCEIGDIKSKRVLDVGCGLGALLRYLQAQYPSVEYSGVDINPNMIREALAMNPEGQFECLDILSKKCGYTDNNFDYVFLSGAFNLSANKQLNNVENLINKMFSLARYGVGVNFLSLYGNNLEPREFAVDPMDMFRICMGVTTKVAVRHDYLPHDFTIYLYK